VPSTAPDLRETLVMLAGRADDDAGIATDLVTIVSLSVRDIAGVDFASVSSHYEGAYATVAASGEVALEVDLAQYADDAGPCLDALGGGHPVAVPELAATMSWPGFRDVAFGLGLRASLSIPLFAGRGVTVAALNLYARDPDAMKALTAAVWRVYEQDAPPEQPFAGLDAGGNDLVAGLVDAFVACAHIQQAVGVLVSVTGDDADHAFTVLCLRAAQTGASLTETATRLLADRPR
jgi:hypothetical protein